MDMICLTIDMRATGENIHQMMRQNGYCVHYVQTAMGFEYPQAVYKWLNGKTLPSVDNLMILSMLFHKSVNDILVTTGGGAFYLSGVTMGTRSSVTCDFVRISAVIKPAVQ